MHPDFQQLMNQAVQQTQSGNLTEAVASIQAALRGGAPPVRTQDDQSDVIDVEAYEIPETSEVHQAETAVPEKTAKPIRKPPVSGDTFITGSFQNSAGQRNYKLYIPPNVGDKPLPLVVMLHGCTQDADDFAAGTAMNQAALTQGFYVLYPTQSAKFNPQKCWNWFKHNHQQRGRGEPLILSGMTNEVIRLHNIDTKRVYVAGLSAGGAMAATLASVYPDLYAAVGVHSGLAPGAASSFISALSVMKDPVVPSSVPSGSGIPTIVFHGDRDATVHPDNAQRVIEASVGSSAHVETLQIPSTRNKHDSTKYVYRNSKKNIIAERWEIHGAGHAWSGGTKNGTYTDQAGPDATTEMLRFFFNHTLNNKT